MRTRSVVKVGVMISGSKVGVKVGGSSSGTRSGVNGMEWNGMEFYHESNLPPPTKLHRPSDPNSPDINPPP